MAPVEWFLYCWAIAALFGAYLLWRGPSQKRQQIMLLEQAHADLAAGRGMYICCALRNASVWDHEVAYFVLAAQIECRLGVAATYCDYWRRLDVRDRNWQAGRLLWIEQMIAAVKEGREIPPPPQPPEYK